MLDKIVPGLLLLHYILLEITGRHPHLRVSTSTPWKLTGTSFMAWLRHVPFLFRLAAIVLMIIALARPRTHEEITQINYEPWHLRYVGPEVAKYMQEMHYCLEEFTQEWQAYIEEYEANGGDFNQLLKERAAIEATVIGYSEDGEEEVSLSRNFH